LIEVTMPPQQDQKQKQEQQPARIIRVRRVDSDAAGFALVSAGSNGPHALDLKLVATEGENAYVGSRQSSPCKIISFLHLLPPFHPRSLALG
jgi:hypothetical protein